MTSFGIEGGFGNFANADSKNSKIKLDKSKRFAKLANTNQPPKFSGKLEAWKNYLGNEAEKIREKYKNNPIVKSLLNNKTSMDVVMQEGVYKEMEASRQSGSLYESKPGWFK